MCGIAGIVRLTPDRVKVDLHQCLSAMEASMVHRGPDDGGIFISDDQQVGLVNRRLAIRDLSPAGHMPMPSADGQVCITYNGEIYNTDEVRPELERLGYRFVSQSDTEVILHGYEAWGQDVVKHLRGMFALAIYDVRASSGSPRLFLARDRLGIKPLYYAQTPEAFVFASELKCLQASGLVGSALSPAALVGYLMLGAVPNPLTIYQDVCALLPGCCLDLELGAAKGTVVPKRYWSLPVDIALPANPLDIADEIAHLLQESVRIRLVSDVPLGAFLSGGLDSSAVVALMRKATQGTIRTCSMVFEEAEYSEAPYARAMAQAVNAEHYERVISAQDLLSEMDNIFYAMDQPTVDGINTYFVSKVAREAGLTVALSGLGGDELFGGYPNTFQGVPSLLHTLTLARMLPYGPQIARQAIQLLPDHARWAKLRDGLDRVPSCANAYLIRRGLFAPSEVKALVVPDLWEAALGTFEPLRHIAERADGCTDGHGKQYANGGAFNWISRAELSTYTHHQLLRDTDVMSMAHSLEVRVPLLDHRLVEAVLRLPAAAKQHNRLPKALLWQAVEGQLPALVRDRRVKQGFTFPFDRWLKGSLRNETRSWRGETSGGLQPAAVEQIWQGYEAGKLHWSRPWALSALQAWVSRVHSTATWA